MKKKKSAQWRKQNQIYRQRRDFPDNDKLYMIEAINNTDDDDRHLLENSIGKMENRINEAGGKNVKIVRDESLTSMSETLLDFAKPLLDSIDCHDGDAYEKAIQMSIACWNAATMMEENEKKGVIRKTIGSFKIHKLLAPFAKNEETRDFAFAMINRKRQMYPHIDRYIVNYEITDTGDDYHVSVASTVPQGYKMT